MYKNKLGSPKIKEKKSLRFEFWIIPTCGTKMKCKDISILAGLGHKFGLHFNSFEGFISRKMLGVFCFLSFHFIWKLLELESFCINNSHYPLDFLHHCSRFYYDYIIFLFH